MVAVELSEAIDISYSLPLALHLSFEKSSDIRGMYSKAL